MIRINDKFQEIEEPKMIQSEEELEKALHDEIPNGHPELLPPVQDESESYMIDAEFQKQNNLSQESELNKRQQANTQDSLAIESHNSQSEHENTAVEDLHKLTIQHTEQIIENNINEPIEPSENILIDSTDQLETTVSKFCESASENALTQNLQNSNMQKSEAYIEQQKSDLVIESQQKSSISFSNFQSEQMKTVEAFNNVSEVLLDPSDILVSVLLDLYEA